MLPKIWIFDTYSILLLIGVIACLVLLYFYFKKRKLGEKYYYDIVFIGCLAIIIGLGSAVGFQTLFDYLKKDSTNPAFSMTFFGGLVGGVIAFILLFFLSIKKKYPEASLINDIVVIAPACIAIAHAFGRLGCFCAGCCHGVETDSIFGVTFPGMTHPVYPTQLFESTFLFVLSAILFIIAYKKDTPYTFCIYLAAYGVWRFCLEFLRGDDRGAFFLSLSPSQWFSIIAFTSSIGLGIFLYFWSKRVKA